MKTLVVYDSQYGNTEKVGMAIGDAIPEAKARARGRSKSMHQDHPLKLQPRKSPRRLAQNPMRARPKDKGPR